VIRTLRDVEGFEQDRSVSAFDVLSYSKCMSACYLLSQAAQCRCSKDMQKSIGKWKIRPPPCKIVTPKNFNLEIYTRDHVGKTTNHANFGLNRYSAGSPPPNKRNITTSLLF